jgi:hypothetical protein
MNRYFIFFLVAFPVIAGSCSGRKNQAERKDIIPEKDVISILTDVYLADGLLAIPEIRYKFTEGDTLSSYIDVIEKHGYNKPQMDRTMRYYFVKKPKKLLKIYDKVLGKLSEMESMVDRELPGFGSRLTNVWQGRQSYSFPDPSCEDTTWVDFSASFYGTYYLKFTLTIYPDDQSVNPALGLFFSITDTAGEEKRIRFSSIPFIKDGRPHNYNITLVQDLIGPVRLKGWFIDHENASPYRQNHHIVDNIILTRNIPE